MGWIKYDANGAMMVNTAASFLGMSDTPSSYSGEAKRVVYVNAGETAIAFAGNLYWDEANDRMGVGTPTPDYSVDVEDTSNDPYVRINCASAASSYLILTEQAGTLYGGRVKYDGASNEFEIGTFDNDVEIDAFFIVRTSGDVGLNKSGPSRKFQVMDDSVSTGVIIPVARIESQVSGGAGAAGHGPSLEWYGETSTTENQSMMSIAARWSVATHASRRARIEFRAAYIGTDVLVGVIEASANASADGNARGAGAIDWQGWRTGVTQVASGTYSVLAGGLENSVDGASAVVSGGWDNDASGNYGTIPGGRANEASGADTFAAGVSATASHDRSFVWGGTVVDSWAADTATFRTHGGFRVYAAAGIATGVEVVAATGDFVPLAPKTHDLGSAALEWDNIYYVTANTGTSRLLDSKKKCPVCDTQMKRGTGTLCIMGEDADYALAFCVNCGNVAMEEWNHHKPGYKARRRPPPEIVVSDIRVKGAGRHREIAVDFRYGDITNSTRLSDDELDIFMNAADNERERLLHDLGLREWESREESRLMIEDCVVMDEQLKEMGKRFIGKNIKRTH